MTTTTTLANDLMVAFDLPLEVREALASTMEMNVGNLRGYLQGIIVEAQRHLDDLDGGGLPDLKAGWSGALGAQVENAHQASTIIKAQLETARRVTKKLS